MKKIVYLFIAIFVVGISSCQKWLDVQPKTEIREDKLFNSETGFKNALIGAYILMGDKGLYGKELTVGFLEVIAHQCEVKTGGSYSSAYKHEYNTAAVENRISAIWSKSYTIIANLNAILGEIENKKSILHPTTYGVIKGEALALRAFIHFDLLRLFGWGGIEYNSSSLNRLSIPYVTKYHKSVTKQSTQKEVIELLYKDLDEAIELLYNYDPQSGGSRPEGYQAIDELFFKNRVSRMNYQAALSTRIRVAMWEANYSKALADVDKFVASKSTNWVDINRSIYNPESKYNDFKLTAENIFRLDIYRLYEGTANTEALKPLVEQFKIQAGVSVYENNEYLYQSEVDVKNLYEYETIGRGDFRYDRFYNRSNEDWTLLKFFESTTTFDGGWSKMPLMKRAEIYYYGAECHNKLGDPAKAVEMLNEVRHNRGIEYKDDLSASLTKEQIDLEIEKEWKKEFISEGYMFYYYKRLNKEIPKASTVSKEFVFTLPLPTNEIEIGNREDNTPEIL